MQDEYPEDEQIKSRSQLKREVEALQTLGENLVHLSDKDIAKVPMPESLADAVHLARKITSRGGRKRQLQYIGRLMRDIDPEPIQRTLDAIAQRGLQSTTKFHNIETWRDRILAEGQPALDAFLTEHPNADRQHLRQLFSNSKKEREQNKPPKSARNLFRYLRELLENEE